MARLLIPYLLGLVLMDSGLVFPARYLRASLVILSISLLGLSWLKGHRLYSGFFGLAIMLWLCLMGCIQYRGAVRLPTETEALVNADLSTGIGLVTEREERTGKGPRLIVQVSAAGLGHSDLTAFRQKILVYATDSSGVLPGDRILFRGQFTTIPPPDNPYAFDYVAYLKYQGIQLRFFAREMQVLPGFSWRSVLLRRVYDLRQICRRRLLRGIPEQAHRSILLALILGDKSDLDVDLRTAFASAGAMHILAVSGLHVGIIGLFAGLLFGWLPIGRHRKPVRIAGSLLFIWLFTILTGAGPSVQRSAVMFTVVLIGQLSGGRARIWNSLAVAAFLLLWWQPLLLFQLGFQLSFLAVAGIVFFHPLLVKCWFPGNPVLKYAWSLFCVGCGAQLTTMPLTIFHFGQFPLLFWLSGWIAIPLATLLLGTGLLKLAFTSLSIADALLGTILEWLTSLLNGSMMLLSSWSFATLDGLVLSPVATWSMYFALLVVMVAHRWRPDWRSWSGWPLLVAGVLAINNQQRRDQQEAWFILVADNTAVLEMLRGDQALRFQNQDTDTVAISYADRGLHQRLGIRRVREMTWPTGTTFIIRGKEECLGVVGAHYPTPAIWQGCSTWLIQTDSPFPEWLGRSEGEGTHLILAPNYEKKHRTENLAAPARIWSLSEKGGLRLPKNNNYE